jgi:hypothetical protein
LLESVKWAIIPFLVFIFVFFSFLPFLWVEFSIRANHANPFGSIQKLRSVRASWVQTYSDREILIFVLSSCQLRFDKWNDCHIADHFAAIIMVSLGSATFPHV